MTLESSCNSNLHVERLRSSGQQIARHYNNTKNELISLQTLALSSLTEKTWQKRWQTLVVSHQFGKQKKKNNKNKFFMEFENLYVNVHIALSVVVTRLWNAGGHLWSTLQDDTKETERRLCWQMVPFQKLCFSFYFNSWQRFWNCMFRHLFFYCSEY